MSLSAMLTQPVSILRHAAGVADDYGNESSSWAVAETVNGRLEQRPGTERSNDGTVVTSDWVLYLPPETVVSAADRVSDQYGRTFEVVGPAMMASTPVRDVLVEVSLRAVEAL